MKKVALSEVKDDLSHYVDLAARQEIVITRHGRPAAVLIGFADEDDWFDYRLENDPRFLEQVAKPREQIGNGLGVPFEKVRKMASFQSTRARKASANAKRSRRR